MKYILYIIPAIALASCADYPVSWGMSADGVSATYSPKGGLVIDVDHTILVDPAK